MRQACEPLDARLLHILVYCILHYMLFTAYFTACIRQAREPLDARTCDVFVDKHAYVFGVVNALQYGHVLHETGKALLRHTLAHAMWAVMALFNTDPHLFGACAARPVSHFFFPFSFLFFSFLAIWAVMALFHTILTFSGPAQRDLLLISDVRDPTGVRVCTFVLVKQVK